MSNSMNVVQHNLTAMFSNRQLGITTNVQKKSSEKLSSGYKINRAADDAAGLSISEKMRRQIRGLAQGTKNTQDGVSVCQIADGALNETHDILQRMNELSVKAANGTLQDADRQYIQAEVEQLIGEIDHIATTTNFNDAVFPLLGQRTIIPGSEITFDNVITEKWENTEASMKKWPFTPNDPPTKMKLSATISGTDSLADGHTYRLIYEDGLTNASSVLVGYTNPDTGKTDSKKISYEQMRIDPDKFYLDEENQKISRTFAYNDPNEPGLSFAVTQTMTLDATNKSYQIETSLENTGADTINGYLFLQNFDTAYGGNHDGDLMEEYYSDGTQIKNETVWASHSLSGLSLMSDVEGVDGELGSILNQTIAGVKDIDAIPATISIANTHEPTLPFSEYIQLNDSNAAFLAVGEYDRTDKYNLIKNYSNDSQRNIEHKDIVFTYATFGDSKITYGIKDLEQDENLSGLSAVIGDLTVYDAGKIWIQSGAEKDHGLYLDIVDARAEAIGVADVKVDPQEEALRAIDKIKEGIQTVSTYRTIFGAQQNRMESIIRHQNNTIENTQAAESLIRDTDMSEEMMRFSNANILAQAGQSMLTQANQTPQGVLSLLS